ncbi:MAG: CusA/CzcA family heavy metal efflux RND transporter [Gammaproteobacteria bacterium]
MIAGLIRLALVQRLMMVLITLAMTAGGILAYRSLPIDAFPEISPPQVQLIIKAAGLTPEEVESRITFPLEMEMQGLPNQTVLRSTSKYALSIVVLDFADGTDIYWARQQVAERLGQVWADLPEGVEGGLAPITSPLGEAFMYRIHGDGRSNAELRQLQDWTIRPQLRGVDGVADVNSLGGEVRAFEVMPKPDKLTEHGISLDELETALNENNRNAGGDRINKGDEIMLVRTVGQIKSLEDIGNITVKVRYGNAIRVNDIAEVRLGHLTRYGGVTANAEGEIVTGLVLLRKGANSRSTIMGVKRVLEELKQQLPEGVWIEPFYDRTHLIEDAVWTVEKVLAEAVVLVIIVLIIMLGNLRSALTVAFILPLSVLFTFILMRITGISANLMSLGGLAIAIGILVDAAVVVVENIHTQLSRAPSGVSKLHLIYRATREVAKPVIAGVLIIIIVFLPLFSLTGLEGKLFAPLAITISFALLGSLLMSLTVIPVLASLLMHMHVTHGEHRDELVVRWLKRGYRPVIAWALRSRAVALSLALIALAASIFLFTKLGNEFMPTMDEGSTVIMFEKANNISLEASLGMDADIQRALMEVPEVTGVVARTGADELRMDPMELYQTDNFILTTPRDTWTRSLAEFETDLRERLAPFKHIEYAFSQPIDMRVSEMITGVRSAIAVKLFGTDLDELTDAAERMVERIRTLPGAIDVDWVDIGGRNYLQIDIDAAALSKYGISVERVNQLIETAVAGKVVSQVIEDNRRTGILLRYPEAARNSVAALNKLLVETPRGDRLPLSRLANISELKGPVQITREGGQRVVVVRADVEGRDVVSFVEEVRTTLERDVPLPQGYYVEFGGQFENQQRASARLALVVPISIVLIFVMLFSTFRSMRQAGLILLNIPFAMIGGIVSLYISGLYMSVPASVGFITLFGVAVLNGVVMVSYFNQLRSAGHSVLDAVREGSIRRLRPVLMTAMIASLGLLPMLLATGPGSELQRPLAVVVIGGLVTSTLLTLILLPTLYAWLEQRLIVSSKEDL